ASVRSHSACAGSSTVPSGAVASASSTPRSSLPASLVDRMIAPSTAVAEIHRSRSILPADARGVEGVAGGVRAGYRHAPAAWTLASGQPEINPVARAGARRLTCRAEPTMRGSTTMSDRDSTPESHRFDDVVHGAAGHP